MKSMFVKTLILSSLLTGCVGSFVPIQTVETTGLNVAENAGKITIVTEEKAQTMQKVEEVVGYSCKNKLWDPDATTDAATFQVKLMAVQRGATAITGLNCFEGSVSLGTNCWQSFTCKATALR